MKNEKLIYLGIIILIVGLLIGSYFVFRSPWKFREDRPIKIFILNSYANASWAKEQVRGFKDYLNEREMDFEVKQFNMNLFEQSSEEQRENVANEAIELIEEYEPDLVYSFGIEAQRHVGMNYVDSKLPWVFSGVIYSDYDVSVENVAGVLDILKMSLYVDFFRDIFPNLKRVAWIYEDNYIHNVVINVIKKSQSTLDKENVEFSYDFVVTFDEFKESVLKYQDEVDVILVSRLKSLYDKDNNLVPQREVVDWLLANNKVPEYSYDSALVEKGLFFGLIISPYGKGWTAGRLAYEILIEGEAPSDLGIITAEIADQHISLHRAKELGLEIPSIVLVNSKVYEEVSWEVVPQAYTDSQHENLSRGPEIFPTEISTGGNK